ncbi:MAG: alpha/beta hydrolase fold domain-containing protein [Clostridium sp.]
MKRKNLILTGALVASAALFVSKAKLIEKRSVSSKAIESYLKFHPTLFTKFNKPNPKYLEKAYKESKKYMLPNTFMKLYNLTKSSDYENTYELLRDTNSEDYTILYLHGGGYWTQPNLLHWRFLKNLSNKVNAKIIVPIYPKAPTFNYKNVYDSILPIYDDLSKKVDLDKLIIMGDSAGGGLALAFSEFIKTKNLPQPKDIILLSPWLDITMTNKYIINSQRFDKLLNIQDLIIRGKYYADDLPTNNYLVSPIYGDISNLGKISIFIGTHDILLPDCQRFKDIAKEQNIEINYFEYPKMPHVFTICPIPEANDSINKICEIIKYK